MIKLGDFRDYVAERIATRAETLLQDEGVDTRSCSALAEEIVDGLELRFGPYPEKNGWYWFYGSPFTKPGGERMETRLFSVKVIHVDGVPKYIAEGSFFENLNAGRWAKALIPEDTNL